MHTSHFNRHRAGALGGGQAAAPPFTPASLGGALFQWFDFSDAGQLFQDSARTTPVAADTNPIGSVTDKSGNGRHAGQTTAGFRPLWRTNLQNGRAVARFDGSDDYLFLPNAYAGVLTSASVYVAVRCRIINTSLWYWGSFLDDSYLNFNGVLYDQFGSTTRQTVDPVMNAPAAGTFVIYTANSAPGAWSCRVDGVVKITTAVNTVGWQSAPFFGGGIRGYGAFDFGEVVVCSRVLTAPEDADMHAYLKARWGTA